MAGLWSPRRFSVGPKALDVTLSPSGQVDCQCFRLSLFLSACLPDVSAVAGKRSHSEEFLEKWENGQGTLVYVLGVTRMGGATAMSWAACSVSGAKNQFPKAGGLKAGGASTPPNSAYGLSGTEMGRWTRRQWNG